MHGAQSRLGGAEVEARAGHPQGRCLVFAQHLVLRRQAGQALPGHADDGHLAAERLVQVLAQAGRFVGVQMDEAVQHDDLGRQSVLAQQLHHARECAQVQRAPHGRVDRGEAQDVGLRRFSGVPVVAGGGGDGRLRALELNRHDEFHAAV